MKLEVERESSDKPFPDYKYDEWLASLEKTRQSVTKSKGYARTYNV